MIEATDHVKRRHLLPTFISKLASYDSNNLTAEVEENYLMNSINEDTSVQKIKPGIRTLAEVAHFVRSIPFLKNMTHEE
jgi:hypothetical protein